MLEQQTIKLHTQQKKGFLVLLFPLMWLLDHASEWQQTVQFKCISGDTFLFHCKTHLRSKKQHNIVCFVFLLPFPHWNHNDSHVHFGKSILGLTMRIFRLSNDLWRWEGSVCLPPLFSSSLVTTYQES